MNITSTYNISKSHHRRLTSFNSVIMSTNNTLYFWFTSIGGGRDARFQYMTYLQAALESGLQNAKSLQPVILFAGKIVGRSKTSLGIKLLLELLLCMLKV